MKKGFILLVICGICDLAKAYDFEFGGLYYVITSVSNKEVGLDIPPADFVYPDSLIIPSIVEYNGKILTVTSMSSRCFDYSSSIKLIKISGTIRKIPSLTFEKCTELKTVIFEEGGILECGYGKEYSSSYSSGRYGLFHACPVEHVEMGRTIYMSYDFNSNDNYQAPFQNIKTLKGVLFTNSTSICKRLFKSCSQLENVIFPSNLNTIEESAFHGCSSLKTIEFPSSLISISKEAFRSCTLLKSIKIPEKVTSVGFYSFANCDSVKTIYIMGCPELHFDAFGDINDEYPSATVYVYSPTPPSIKYYNGMLNVFMRKTHLNKLYVPQNSKELYANASIWKEFWDIIEMGSNINTKCSSPVISYIDNKIIFNSSTPNVKYYYSISCDDTSTFAISNGEVNINAIYNISVYAVADGYIQSDIVHGLLIFNPSNAQISDNINELYVESSPIIISNCEGLLTISGLNENQISFFDLSGKYLGSSKIYNNTTTFNCDKLKMHTILIKGETISIKYVMTYTDIGRHI